MGRVVGTGLAVIGHGRGGTASRAAEHGAGHMVPSEESTLARCVRHVVLPISQKSQRVKSIYLTERRRRSCLKPPLLKPTNPLSLVSHPVLPSTALTGGLLALQCNNCLLSFTPITGSCQFFAENPTSTLHPRLSSAVIFPPK